MYLQRQTLCKADNKQEMVTVLINNTKEGAGRRRKRKIVALVSL